jgi:hypothetical protein
VAALHHTCNLHQKIVWIEVRIQVLCYLTRNPFPGCRKLRQKVSPQFVLLWVPHASFVPPNLDLHRLVPCLTRAGRMRTGVLQSVWSMTCWSTQPQGGPSTLPRYVAMLGCCYGFDSAKAQFGVQLLSPVIKEIVSECSWMGQHVGGCEDYGG